MDFKPFFFPIVDINIREEENKCNEIFIRWIQ